jgi:hypothetical protein
VGWKRSEEVNRVAAPADGPVDNFGWPCYKGQRRQAGFDGADLKVCENLYPAGKPAVRGPYFSYNHADRVVQGESCSTGDSSLSGLAFYRGGAYPANYDGALLFADYSRKCIWAMKEGTNGRPDPDKTSTLVAGAADPVDLETGPGGDLFYVDLNGGTIHRITYFAANQPPLADARANPTSGPTPLAVDFDGTGSTDPDGDAISYEWDFTGDGPVDAAGASASHTYQDAGTYVAKLTVTDAAGNKDSDTIEISPGNTPPVVKIDSPLSTRTWKVGSEITFSGSASDEQDGTLVPSRLSWSLIMHHCYSVDSCHEHRVRDFPGVAGGSFVAPDHEYPAYLELRLKATDSRGLTDTESVRLDPKTVKLRFASRPTGARLVVGSSRRRAPFTRTVIVGSTNSVSAPSRHRRGGNTYYFHHWSDGRARTHNIIAPSSETTYMATFRSRRR